MNGNVAGRKKGRDIEKERCDNTAFKTSKHVIRNVTSKVTKQSSSF